MPNEYFNPPNSIWPNGLKKDDEGYAIFYPLGTNKVDINTITWPEGDKLISPFVYQDDKLVGFVDTKALTVSGSATTTMNYNHIEADFASISEGKLTVNAPNALVKKFSWAVSTGGDGTFDFVIIDFNTTDQETINAVRTAKRVADNKLYAADDNLIGTIDTSKIEVGGIYDEETLIFDGLFCNLDYNGNERGLILSEFNSDLSSLRDGAAMFACCSNLTTFTSNLSSLTEGYEMFYGCTALNSFSSDLPNLTDGSYMFMSCSNLESFSTDLSSLTDGYWMFNYCTNLTSFSSDLPNLTDGERMFYYCTKLTSFTSDLSSLTNGNDMFHDCENLTSFSSDLSNLTNGYYMFCDCSKLESFSTDLSSLTDGRHMFYDCKNLTSFSSDLSSLTDGYWMFYNCDNLTSFNSDLSNLTRGYYMFYGCSLDEESVKNIADTINTYSGTIHIGIGNSEPNEQEKAAFNTIASKGWTVYVNGSKYTPTSPAAITTLDENGEERTTPIPFYAKPVEATEESAEYVDEQGNFFNIVGAQFIYGDDLSTYGMFTCEADAAANMRLTKIEKGDK